MGFLYIGGRQLQIVLNDEQPSVAKQGLQSKDVAVSQKLDGESMSKPTRVTFFAPGAAANLFISERTPLGVNSNNDLSFL